MKIVLGSDHAGFELKEELRLYILSLGHQVVDVGTDSTVAVDYPDFAEKVAHGVLANEGSRGVLLCGSGVGASIAANKVKGIRAGNITDAYSAHQGVEHDAMNILVLGARVIGSEVAKELVRNFLAAEYTGEERHARRLAKVLAIESENLG